MYLSITEPSKGGEELHKAVQWGWLMKVRRWALLSPFYFESRELCYSSGFI